MASSVTVLEHNTANTSDTKMKDILNPTFKACHIPIDTWERQAKNHSAFHSIWKEGVRNTRMCWFDDYKSSRVLLPPSDKFFWAECQPKCHSRIALQSHQRVHITHTFFCQKESCWTLRLESDTPILKRSVFAHPYNSIHLQNYTNLKSQRLFISSFGVSWKNVQLNPNKIWVKKKKKQKTSISRILIIITFKTNIGTDNFITQYKLFKLTFIMKQVREIQCIRRNIIALAEALLLSIRNIISANLFGM